MLNFRKLHFLHICTDRCDVPVDITVQYKMAVCTWHSCVCMLRIAVNCTGSYVHRSHTNTNTVRNGSCPVNIQTDSKSQPWKSAPSIHSFMLPTKCTHHIYINSTDTTATW